MKRGSLEHGIVVAKIDRVVLLVVNGIAVATVSIVVVGHTLQVKQMVNHHIVMARQIAEEAIHIEVTESHRVVVTAI